ncbi:MAG: chemotaxis protein CheR [Spirochaetaceae bacterium]|nr:MAG: chemotaxis protein CheR [Spirochaetaceae bacterium]
MAGNATTERRRSVQHTGLFRTQEIDDESVESVDFKMVTFSLGGKLYGVDIMMVSEIAKFDEFTYVPNTPPFVAGVYNLRGEIISVIDLRVMFRLPVPSHGADEPADGLILRLETGLIGVIVDSIDRVVGVSSQTIQPPHPIFADVNIRYISGVVEFEQQLYIILDTERILGPELALGSAPGTPKASGSGAQPLPASDRVAQTVAGDAKPPASVLIDNVSSTLHSLTGFVVSPVNLQWVEQRVANWQNDHDGEVDVTTPESADRFLRGFATPDSSRLWTDEYRAAVAELLPEPRGTINVWNPGCGAGYETYSVAALLRSVYPDSGIKVWAGDKDLLRISTAPNMIWSSEPPSEFYLDYMVKTREGYAFTGEIKDLILFEFSDFLHGTTLPPFSIVVIRDVLSYLPEEHQQLVVRTIEDGCLRPCLIITGTNEDLLPIMRCKDVSRGPVRGYLLE